MTEDRSMQLRILLAFLLSVGIMALWGVIFPPPKPTRPPALPPPAAVEEAAAQATAIEPPAAAPAVIPVRGATEEQTLVVENTLYRVEFSNRGGVVRSWQLKNYRDDAKPPQTLDVVHPEAARQLNGWPLSLMLEDPGLEGAANTALYEIQPAGGDLHAPAEVTLAWSDGRLAVTKKLRFESSYIVEMESEVLLDGKPLPHAVAWRSGFGDDTVYNAAETVQVAFRNGDKRELLAHAKLGQENNRAQRLRQEGALAYATIEDRYFVAVFLPVRGGLALWHWKQERTATRDKKSVTEPVAEIAAGSTAPEALSLRLYVGPKDVEQLGQVNPPLTELVDFGWFGLISRPLFYFLKWIYGYVGNYGWAIVLMTIVINMVMFPLKVKSWRSMQRMQKVMPEVKTIQEKYKKYSMRDPRRQQMNQEVMAVYKREGVNPAGSCLPMLLQMPIWFALYQMLNATIELRHAPWIWWIKDLSARDPYYILPIVMAVTFYVMQKMTPTTTTDPAQQRMMQMMPIMFGGMFIIIPISSGLVLYILTSNVVGVAQQWYLNRTSPVAPPRSKEKGKKK